MAVTDYMCVSQAAARKNITRSAMYHAIHAGRIRHTVITDNIVLRPKDVDAYVALPPGKRMGNKVGGRRHGVSMTETAKARLSETQRRRWAERKSAAAVVNLTDGLGAIRE